MEEDPVPRSGHDVDPGAVASRPAIDQGFDRWKLVLTDVGMESDVLTQPAKSRCLVEDAAQAGEDEAGSLGDDIVGDGSDDAELVLFFRQHKRDRAEKNTPNLMKARKKKQPGKNVIMPPGL
jgi:hypothetical protein